MPDLKYGGCDCEYPCSCVQFEGKFYGSWKDIIDDLIKQRDQARVAVLNQHPTTNTMKGIL